MHTSLCRCAESVIDAQPAGALLTGFFRVAVVVCACVCVCVFGLEIQVGFPLVDPAEEASELRMAHEELQRR